MPLTGRSACDTVEPDGLPSDPTVDLVGKNLRSEVARTETR